MALYSVVIPTLNRAHRLKDALQSILWQDFDDYEVIVSDNCSSDNTGDLVAQFADKRIHYVRPDSYLRMHDHWEFARKQASGDYLLFLGDDDCLVQNALSTLTRVIETTGALIVGCKNIDYYTVDYWVQERRNQILIRPYSGELARVETRVALSECFRFNPEYLPRVTVPIARSLVKSITEQVGRFFDYPYPEYVGFAMAFSMTDEYRFLDQPLVVLGRTSDSYGPRYFWSNQDPSWHETTGQPFVNVPLKGTYFTNGAAESFLRAKNNLPSRFEGINLSLLDYYKNYYTDMLTQQQLGRNIGADLDEYYRAVGALAPELQHQVLDSIRPVDLRNPGWYKLLRKANSFATSRAKQVKALITNNHTQNKGGRWIDGSQVGVSDIRSCTEWLGNQKQNFSDRL